jgi:CubicO group peptidase (beta-lactamase class C family)
MPGRVPCRRAMPSLPRPPRLLVPKVKGVPDLLRRVDVPKDLDVVERRAAEVAPQDAGMTRDGVEKIWSVAKRLFRSGVHPCVQVCVRREGQVVLNRSLGWKEPGVIARPDDPFCVFSASKAVTATVVHLLDERGVLHVDDRVAEYLPEFARHGKEAITIEHVLSHRAGVPNLPREALDLDVLHDPERIRQLLFDAKPMARPGKLLAYHAVSGGFLLGEVVRAATGKDIRQVLEEEVLDPLGFRFGSYGVAPEDLPLVGRCEATGPPALPPLSTILTRALGVPVDEIVRLANDPRFLTGIIPAANVVASADELSRFFELLRAGGTLDGVQVLEPRTIRRAVVERSWMDFDLSLGAPIRHSAGFMLGAERVSLFGPDTDLAFGHLGFTNTLGWADPERAVSVGIVTSGKPTFYLELPDLWALGRRIGLEAPKVTPADRAV